jgi:GAF domain-containing protein
VDELGSLHQLIGALDRAEIDREAFLVRFMRGVAAAIGCSRAGFWVFRDERGERILHCVAMYDATRDALVQVTDMVPSDVEPYFDALLRDGCVVAADARTHPSTSCFLDEYLLPLDVRSLMDVCFSVNGVLFGTFSCEEVGSTRQWTGGQLALLRRIAAAASLALARAAKPELDTAPAALSEPASPWREDAGG